jgi:hypothetical protein
LYPRGSVFGSERKKDRKDLQRKISVRQCKLSGRELKALILGGETNTAESEMAGRRAMYTFFKMADMLLTCLHFRHLIRHFFGHFFRHLRGEACFLC